MIAIMGLFIGFLSGLVYAGFFDVRAESKRDDAGNGDSRS
jgi:hypothetical protein